MGKKIKITHGSIPDPFKYIGRVRRDKTGRVRVVHVFYGDEEIALANGDEFITFITVRDLERPLDAD